MMTVKEQAHKIIDRLPEDSSLDEIIRELEFNKMVDRGLSEAKEGLGISSDEMQEKINSWQKK